ncbi:MAG: YfhO family protein [Acidobacteriota bacterium]
MEKSAREEPTTASTTHPPDKAKQRADVYKDFFAYALLSAAIGFFFLPLFWPGDIYFYRDVTFDAYPLSAVVKQCFDTRVLPLWNPYIGFGQPLLTDPAAQVIYPTTLLRILLPAPLAYKWHVILHSWWAAMGMFLLCRRWRLSRLAALMGALGFVFAGPFVSYINFMIAIATAAWIPWALWALERALSNWQPRRALLFGGVLGLQLLACEAVTCLQTVMLCGVYALTLHGNWRRLRAPENINIVSLFLIGGIFSLLVSAVYLFPFLHYVLLGRRGAGLTAAEANVQSLHPLFIFDLIAPKLFLANPFSADDSNPWMKALNSGFPAFAICIYLGATQVALALFATLTKGERRQRFFALLALVTLLLACGHYLHLFDLLRWSVPIFRTMRYPVKFLLLTSFAVSALAAYGLERLRQSPQQLLDWRGLLPVLLLALLLLLPALYLASSTTAYQALQTLAGYLGIENVTIAAQQLQPTIRLTLLRSLLLIVPLLLAAKLIERKPHLANAMALALLIISLVELALVSAYANPVINAKVALYQPELIKHFPAPQADYRIYPNEGASVQLVVPKLRPYPGPESEAVHYYTRSLLIPHDNITYGIYTGIDSDKKGLYPNEYIQVQEFIDQADKTNDQLTRLLARANIRYVVAQRPLAGIAGLRPVGVAENFSVQPTYIYELEAYLPQTYLAMRGEYLPTGATTIARLASSDFADRREVILNDISAPQLETSAPATTLYNTSRIVARTLRSFTIEAELSAPAYLVVLHHCMPGWRVTVNGQRAKYYRANQLFMAVPLSAGRHRVEFSYLPTEFLIGLIVSLLSVTVSIGWLSRMRVKRSL